MTTTWPTTRGLEARLDSDAVRRHFATIVAVRWGERVNARMQQLGLNNAQLAALSGTTPQTIQKVRYGQIVARDYLRYTIAAALATSVESLFPLPAMKDVSS